MTQKRILSLYVFFGICSLVLIGRLYYLQVIRHSEFYSMAVKEMAAVNTNPPRGGIYDRLGREMALSVQVPSAYIVPKRSEDPRAILNSFSRIPWINKKLMKDAFSENKGFVWVKRMLNPRQRYSLEGLGIKEIRFVEESERFYPHSELGGQILGFVGTEEKGLEGLEFYFDGFLSGRRDTFPQGHLSPGRDDYYYDIAVGYNLFLTIDLVIQYLAEDALRKGCKQVNAEHGLVLIMDTYTGQILAMANWPGYNPNRFFDYPEKFWRNRCVTDMYEPGSIFKVFWAAALLEEELASSNDIVYCEQGSMNIAGKKIRDYKKFGWLSLKQVIESSSNIGAIKLAQKLGADKFYQYIDMFGFGKKTGIEFPGEARGILRHPDNWSQLSLASISIGQEISVTPIQMITAFSALVNGGRLMKPVILKEVRDSKGDIRLERAPAMIRQVISEQTSRRIKSILRGVVDRGTGQKAYIPGYCIGGKTGTAQLLDKCKAGYSHEDFLASFIGFFPDFNARLAMLVMVYKPQDVVWGGEVAAPIFGEVAQKVIRYLNIPPVNQNSAHGKQHLPITAQILKESTLRVN